MTKFHYMGAGIFPTKLFCLIFFLGIILFVVWAVRTLDKKELKKWVIGLLVVGLLGMIGSSYFMKGKKADGDWKVDKCEYCEKLCGDSEG